MKKFQEQILKVKQLLDHSKYTSAKKVLSKLRASTQKESLEIELLQGASEIGLKNYRRAKFKLDNCLKKVETDEDKASLLQLFIKLSECSGNQTEANDYRARLVEIGVVTTQRAYAIKYDIVASAFKCGDFIKVVEYGTQLLHVSKYTYNCFTLVVGALIALNRLQEAKKYQLKLEVMLRSRSREPVYPNLLIQIVKNSKLLTSASNFILLKRHIENYYPEVDFNEAVCVKEANLLSEENVDTLERYTVHDADIHLSVHAENLKNLIKDLILHMANNEAVFSEKLIIRSDEMNNLSLYSKEFIDSDDSLSLPICSLPVVNDYNFNLSSDFKISFTAKNKQINKRASLIMTSMVNIYNEAGKVKDWLDNSLLLNKKDFNRIVLWFSKVKSNNSVYNRLMNSEIIDNSLIIESFLGSRVFRIDSKLLLQSGIKTDYSYEYVFLPLIDFANHSATSPGFNLDENKGRIIVKSESVEKYGEILVRYNKVDPVDIFLTYGFFDQSSLWITSTPVEISLSNKIRLNIKFGGNNDELEHIPASLLSVKEFLPTSIRVNDNVIEISNFKFPVSCNAGLMESLISFALEYASRYVYLTPLIDIKSKARNRNIIILLLNENLKAWNTLQDEIVSMKKYNEHIADKGIFRELVKLKDFHLQVLRDSKRNFLNKIV